MPVETTDRKIFYSCNGSQVIFPFTFPISAETDLVVKVRTDATGAVSTLTLTTNYTVSKTGSTWDSGGNVTTVDTYATGKTLMIKRVTTLDQTKDYIESDDFPAESHEEGLDKLTRIAQELQEELDRSLKMPDTDDEDLDMTIPNSVDRASKWLGFDADGQPTAVQTTPSSVTVSAFAETILDDADAAAVRTTIDALQDADEVIDVNKLADDASYKNAQTRYYNVPLWGYVTTLAGNIYAYAFKISFVNAAGSVVIPVDLPHEATITEVKAWGEIGTADHAPTFILHRNEWTTNGYMGDTLASFNIAAGATSGLDNAISYADIDNSSYKYIMRVINNAGTPSYDITGIRIKYTVLKPLP